MHCLNDFRVFGVGLDLFSKLRDVLIAGAGVGEVVLAPALVHEGVAVEYLAGAGVEGLEEADFAEAEVDGGGTAAGAQFGGEYFEAAHAEGCVGLFGVSAQGAAGDCADALVKFFAAGYLRPFCVCSPDTIILACILSRGDQDVHG